MVQHWEYSGWGSTTVSCLIRCCCTNNRSVCWGTVMQENWDRQAPPLWVQHAQDSKMASNIIFPFIQFCQNFIAPDNDGDFQSSVTCDNPTLDWYLSCWAHHWSSCGHHIPVSPSLVDTVYFQIITKYGVVTVNQNVEILHSHLYCLMAEYTTSTPVWWICSISIAYSPTCWQVFHVNLLLEMIISPLWNIWHSPLGPNMSTSPTAAESITVCTGSVCFNMCEPCSFLHATMLLHS